MAQYRSFYALGDHVICLQEVSHFSLAEKSVVVVMRNGAQVVFKPEYGLTTKSVYDRLIKAIRDGNL